MAVSQTNSVLNLVNMSNVNVAGQFIYMVGEAEIIGTDDEPDRVCPEQ